MREDWPTEINHDLLFQGNRIGTAWARGTCAEGSGDFDIECYQQMFDVEEIGLKRFKKYTRYQLNADGLLKSAILEDSNGGRAEIRISGATLTFDGQKRELDDSIGFVLEANAIPLIAYQVLLRPIEVDNRLFCLLADSGDTLPLVVGPSDEGFTTSLGERYTLGEDGVIESVTFASPDLTVKRVFRKIPNWRLPLGGRRFEYVPPSDITVDDVEIIDEHYDAGATVARPKSIDETKAVAVFVNGTGVYTRHGFTATIDIGTHQLLDGLARNGIASIRYDKFDRRAPTVVAAETEQDFSSLCRDAIRWLNWLDAENWADGLPRLLIGHSLGGLIALEVATQKPLAGVVALATPGRTFRTLTAEQYGWFQSHIGLSEKAKETATAQRDAFIAALEMTEEWTEETVPAEVLASRSKRRLFKSLLDLDPTVLVAKGSAPFLIVQGLADMQVTEIDAERLAVAAITANRQTETILAPGLDHYFKRNTAEGMAILKKLADRRRRIPVKLIRRIAAHIKQMIAP